MPLPAAIVPREHSHTRKVTCEGFEREDGLFDIEGRMTDTKTYDIDNRDRGGQIRAGEAIHDMSIRLTIDLDFNIRHVDAIIDYSPFNICPKIADRFKQLEGEQIAAGWNRKVKSIFAGTQGCTHLSELLGPIATTAFQATVRARAKRAEANKTSAEHSGAAEKPKSSFNPLVNSCHALAQDSEVVKVMWPEQYQAKES